MINPDVKAEPMADDDHEALMDHMALEAMRAVESKDHSAFRQAHHVLVADILEKLSSEMETKEDSDS
jgi:hypothetical protein